MLLSQVRGVIRSDDLSKLGEMSLPEVSVIQVGILYSLVSKATYLGHSVGHDLFFYLSPSKSLLFGILMTFSLVRKNGRQSVKTCR